MSKAKQLSPRELFDARLLRWKCRTDLEFLCREVLGYKDVNRTLHGPVLDVLQKFPFPKNQHSFEDHDQWDGKKWVYKPLCDMQALEGGRRVLLLDPRGWLKTTINAQAHTIQWMLNYPDIAMAIFQSNLEKAELILLEIKNHFMNNDRMRDIFPEFCPPKGKELGTKGAFVSPARHYSVTRREPTLMALSIEKGLAGLHFHVMKFSDIVEPENVKTEDRINDVNTAFYMAENLLISPVYWIDVEGTRYHYADLYGEIVDKWWLERKENRPHKYRIHVRGCFDKGIPAGEAFTPDKLELPDKKDENGKLVSLFPTDHKGQPRFPLEHYEDMRKNDAYLFSCQQLNAPSGSGDDVVFPVDKLISRNTISVTNFRRNIRINHREITIDTAETIGPRSNYTAIVVGAWDGYGRCYVEHITHKKMLPKELVDTIFKLNKQFKPSRIAIEETGFVRGLHAAIERTSDLTGVYLPLEFLKRDNKEAKTERIAKSLQPAYISGDLRIVVDLDIDEDGKSKEPEWWAHVKREFMEFPVGKSDDILDALADQFAGKDYFGRLNGRPAPDSEPGTAQTHYLERLYKLDNPLADDYSEDLGSSALQSSPFSRTGGL